jgi:hypothetical protein
MRGARGLAGERAGQESARQRPNWNPILIRACRPESTGGRGENEGGVAERVSYPLRFSQTRSGTVMGLGAGIMFKPGKSDAAPYILVELELSLVHFPVRCRF